MRDRPYTRFMLIGSAIAAVSLSAAWSVGHVRVPVEPAPMAEAPETKAVVWDLPRTKNASVDQWIVFVEGATGIGRSSGWSVPVGTVR